MAQYAIGDLQGCYQEFDALLRRIDFNPSRDHLYCVGDIVARGPDSLSCLRRLYDMRHAVTITLGNHDLHLLATAHLGKKANPKDKLDTLFNAPDLAQLLSFLQQQPLAVWLEQDNMLLCHAGLSPQWSLPQGLKFAQFAQQCYQGSDAKEYFANMYNNSPTHWQDSYNDLEKFIYTINSFTRMRFVDALGHLDLSHKGSPQQGSPLMPWFEHPNRTKDTFDIAFGHWAALQGTTNKKNVHALDTGCVWGGAMTCMDIKNRNKVVEKSHQ
ncbi:symmetrical bis(5'-nucleosyl)-tetraphosphatase [Pseudoalteromonas sp. SSDWG2]|uniref:symmetrical bis(5'-nucleosyl)-tetraphosphatase n=1 Tax=Pseudoalteromonas sp. SSDWG2 TaxID=3139391 RepID=UPI003BAC7209